MVKIDRYFVIFLVEIFYPFHENNFKILVIKFFDNDNVC